ncbi:MAG: 5'/3'-nucleotidase SurE [Candidatus Azobacteroides pseudotrichonymphae]|jgi:5'-nucleotidase|uniref:5'-nucleotidase SurE n=1 Tax=Azobacteroides pseudotrichonymphae genomovar. CFP2 TaxID=511995 RepID=B6YRQ5_AZOPC|nr:5'/3'-nucleotidase SurE [Candidatus Azobacteroides pseudotrichonymphae]BAG83877.1 5'-nucleotidase [Candidatus Azobacteroides pseudotrichonymphae genomovar. CFP2]GMO33047.1 MAG: 5'/3'-nucleotidase SurE [Candidatus Azobacteroides pseudotrichonymphae]
MSKNKRPLVFITNDDGIYAKGLNELIKGFRKIGEIVVVAPEGARSGMSGAITSLNPVRIDLLRKEEDLTIYSCSGTPVDCVKLGVNSIVSRKPDLLVAGINHGSNAAVCVIYSGTIGATLEGCIIGIPSMGVSLTDHSPNADFSQAVKYGKLVAEKVLLEGLPKGICLNLNVPSISDVKGLKICTQTKGNWQEKIEKLKDPYDRVIYWLGGEFANEEPENTCCDEWALSKGYAALVPLQVDMTAHYFYELWKKKWEFCTESNL